MGDKNPLIDLVRGALTRSVIQMMAHEPGVRLGEDPEEVHQYRVGIRRLRADLYTFKALFKSEPLRELTDELSWLSSIIGAVRDNDVLAHRLHTDSSTLERADAAGVRLLLSLLASQAATERSALFAALGSPRYLSLLDVLIAFANDPPIRTRFTKTTRSEGDRSAVKFIRRPWMQLSSGVEGLDANSPDAALHHVRILAKRCRYAAEAVTPMVEHAGSFATRLADLQTVLGDHQDAVVTEHWLREFAVNTPQSALVGGELIFVQRLRQANTRTEWPTVWKMITQERLICLL